MDKMFLKVAERSPSENTSTSSLTVNEKMITTLCAYCADPAMSLTFLALKRINFKLETGITIIYLILIQKADRKDEETIWRFRELKLENQQLETPTGESDLQKRYPHSPVGIF